MHSTTHDMRFTSFCSFLLLPLLLLLLLFSCINAASVSTHVLTSYSLPFCALPYDYFRLQLAKFVLAHSIFVFFFYFVSANVVFSMIEYETHMAPCRPNYREKRQKRTHGAHIVLKLAELFFSFIRSIISFNTVTLKLPFKTDRQCGSMQDEDEKKSEAKKKTIFIFEFGLFFLIFFQHVFGHRQACFTHHNNNYWPLPRIECHICHSSALIHTEIALTTSS